MKLLLDTTLLIDVLRDRLARPVFLRGLAEAGNVLTTSARVAGEVYSGLRVGEEARTEALFESLNVYPVTASIARQAGLLVRDQKLRGVTATLADMMIAATALMYGLTLVTDNVKHFQIEGL